MKPTSAHINTLGKVQFPKEKNLEVFIFFHFGVEMMILKLDIDIE